MMMRRSSAPFALFALTTAVAATACGADPSEETSPPPDAGIITSAADAATNAQQDADSTVRPDAAVPPDSGVLPATGLPILGNNTHEMTNVTLTEISSGGMNLPRDLAFNPEGDMELWVVNERDDSTVTYFGVGSPSMTADYIIDPYALHFMDAPSSIAFGAPGTFGTCQESRNTYGDTSPPNDFMGPSLWPSDMEIYGQTNPQAVADLGFDLGSHIDMLHESPLCMGIEWDHDNVYWTFDGQTGSVSRCDFKTPHDPGYDDHSDGTIDRYVAGELARVAGVPSHLALDRDAGFLYIADTGNARIAVLDITTGERGRSLPVKEPGTVLTEIRNATLTTLVDARAGELEQPSGIALHGEMILVADHATSRITAFDKTTGERLDYLDTGLVRGSLMGIELDAEGMLYFVDSKDARLYRISPK